MVIIRIERISDNKIKVEINGEDIKVWNVNIKNLTENTPEAQSLFKHALKQAEEKLNFSIGTSQLMVEAIPLSAEGFIMIISKVGESSDLNKLLSLKGRRTELGRDANSPQPSGVYKFSDFEDMCSGTGEIFDLFYGKSFVYKYKDKYYLALLPSDMFGYYEADNKLSEFAEKVPNPKGTMGFLREHGELLIPSDAVDILSNYFN